MATSTQLVNNALRAIGIDGSVNNPNGHALIDDLLYNSTLAYCLTLGFWAFAIRGASIASSGTPAFGFSYRFTKPADYLKLAMISSASSLVPPLSDYLENPATFEANSDPIYIRYVSNDAGYGLSLATWPEWFTRLVEMELAWRVSPRTDLKADDRDRIKGNRDDALKMALSDNSKPGSTP